MQMNEILAMVVEFITINFHFEFQTMFQGPTTWTWFYSEYFPFGVWGSFVWLFKMYL